MDWSMFLYNGGAVGLPAPIPPVVRVVHRVATRRVATEWPLGLVSVHRAPERERQSSLPSYHAARRALRGLEKNTTPSDPQWCGSFTEWPLGEWPPSGHSV